jgi:hypothetical protein
MFFTFSIGAGGPRGRLEVNPHSDARRSFTRRAYSLEGEETGEGEKAMTVDEEPWGLVRLFPIHMDWMGLEKIVKKFDLFGI